MNKYLISIVILLFIFAAAGQYAYHLFNNKQEEIAAAEADKEKLIKVNAELEKTVKDLTQQQEQLQKEVDVKEAKVNELRDKVQKLEAWRQDNTLAVYHLRTSTDTLNEFKKAFPKLKGGTKVAIQEVPVKNKPPAKIEYLLIPIRYVEHFLRLKIDEESYEKQNIKLKEMDALHVQIGKLKDEKFRLQQEKTAAYNKGYQKAFDMYLKLNEVHIALLKQPPKIDFMTSFMQAIVPLAGGVAIGASF